VNGHEIHVCDEGRSRYCDDSGIIEDRIESGLDWFEAHPEALEIGEDLTLSQIALGCLLGYLDFRFGDRPWRTNRPNLTAFSEAMFARPSFETTKPL
jgi:glutathione S-transferase